MLRTMFMTAATGLALAGCSIQSAQMRTPAGFAETAERLPVVGAGHGTRGDFQFAGLEGRFERSNDRLSFFNALNLRSGYTRYVIGIGTSQAIDVDCRMREKTLEIGIVAFTPQRMAYRCSVGLPQGEGWIEVQEIANWTLKRERRGVASIDGVELTLASVHKMKGSSIETATPLGYVFERDGRPVGAVDINGRPVVMVAPGADARERRAVSLAALALALFWDPATTGDDA